MLSLDIVDRAKTHLDAIEVSKLTINERATLTATWGLYHYRIGEYNRGREYYLQAVRESRDTISRALASIMLAREELRAEMPGAADTREEAVKLGNQDQTELGAWLDQLKQPPAR